jgi:Na+/H+ antiporter NhaD/arsenite permease-like protein
LRNDPLRTGDNGQIDAQDHPPSRMIFLAVFPGSAPQPHPAMMIPFVALLLCIACCPLLTPKFWERHYPKFSVCLGAISVGYYLFILRSPGRIGHVAMEYFSFITYIGAFFVVAGGIHLRTKGESTPMVNTLFLGAGAVLANLLGTTGASMLLIRPWIRINKYRFNAFHAAFFIFLVSNVGGCLTPIGDPPLFLGYLKGIPFFWITTRCLPAWLITCALLLTIFYVLDRLNFLRAPKDVREKETGHEEFRIEGRRNFIFLGVIVATVILMPPSLVGMREIVLLAAAFASYRLTSRDILAANHFTFGPIREIAWLFAGIFATMIPALDYLALHANSLGLTQPIQFYWLTGALSGVLDNAPAYLAFLAAAFGIKGMSVDHPAEVIAFLEQHSAYVVAVSLGAVFFGAGTYIGNGPNLMVKAICDYTGVKTPSFFNYIFRYSLPFLLPVLTLVGWIFFGK